MTSPDETKRDENPPETKGAPPPGRAESSGGEKPAEPQADGFMGDAMGDRKAMGDRRAMGDRKAMGDR